MRADALHCLWCVALYAFNPSSKEFAGVNWAAQMLLEPDLKSPGGVLVATHA